MALPVTIPNTFANATTSIPLSQLDTNFSTLANAINGINSGSETLANLKASNVTITGGVISNVTLDNVTVQTESFDNVTMSNVTITSGNATVTNLTATQANLTTANVTTLQTANAQITGGTITGITDLTVADGGTGRSTLTAEAVLIGDGANPIKFLSPGANGTAILSNGSAWYVGNAATSVTITNDTSTNASYFPLFANVTSGTATSVFTSNASATYNPSLGQLESKAMAATNGIFVNSANVATNYTIGSGYNGLSGGPITVNSNVSVTVSSGSVWTVV